MQYARNKKKSPRFNFGAKKHVFGIFVISLEPLVYYYNSYSSRTKILLRVYLTNRLELDAHIFTQGKYGTLDVPFGGLVDFGLGGSIFGAKNYVFGNKSCTRRISGTAWI